MSDLLDRTHYQPGRVYQHFPGKFVSEADHVLFCLITQMTHPIHLDEVFASHATKHRTILVASSYMLSILMGVSADIAPKVYEDMEIVSIYHPLPVFHGDTIYGETTVLEQSDPAGDTALQTVLLETKGINQHGAMTFSFVRKFLLEAS